MLILLIQVGLLKSESIESPTKDSSPFKEIMQTLEKPPPSGADRKTANPFAGMPGTRQLNSPPRSADYYNKSSKVFFFQNFGAGRKGMETFKIVYIKVNNTSSFRT